MPEVRSGEDKKTFVARCIPIVLEEGTASDEKQAAAICYSYWKNKKEDTMQEFEDIRPSSRSGNEGALANQYPDELDPSTLPDELRSRHHRTAQQELDENFPIK